MLPDNTLDDGDPMNVSSTIVSSANGKTWFLNSWSVEGTGIPLNPKSLKLDWRLGFLVYWLHGVFLSWLLRFKSSKFQSFECSKTV